MSDPACEVWFYHLERASLDQVLPELIEKTMARGWRALVRSPQREHVEHLDAWLWGYRDDSFLAHGLAGEPDADRQPVLLGHADAANDNGAHVLFLLDGATPGALDGYARCIILFDGRDDAALAAAREHWKAFRAAKQPATYWRQSDRGWEKQG